MLDFADTGQIGLFVDEAMVATREATIGKGGIFPGAELAFVFSSLRANDLVWPYVVNNYLLGGKPAAFDLLYWNSDSTNLPGPMYCHYLRNTYLENKLQGPGRTSAAIGVAAVCRGDARGPHRPVAHGVPEPAPVQWRENVCPRRERPHRRHRQSAGEEAAQPLAVRKPSGRIRTTGFAAAKEIKGSWWPRWSEWLAQHSGGKRAAPRKTGNAKYKPIEPAPGRYVKQKAH